MQYLTEGDNITPNKYHQLLLDFVHRPRNVTFTDHQINLQKGKREYFKARGDEECNIANCNWSFQNSQDSLKISRIGPIEWDGHVIAPGLSKFINDNKGCERDSIDEYDGIFPDDQTKIEQNEIATTHCHGVYFKPGKVGIVVLNYAYKGKATCWHCLTISRRQQNHTLENKQEEDDNKRTNRIDYYYSEQELKRAQTKSKFKVNEFPGATDSKRESTRITSC